MQTKKLFVLILLLSITNAGTIGLQTSCNFTNSTLNFLIRNVGNDTAYGISIGVYFEGKEVYRSGVGNLVSGDKINFGVPLKIDKRGDYLAIVSISYTDSSGVPASTLAHCGFSYVFPLAKIILISPPKITQIDSTHQKLEMNITNLANNETTSNFYLVLPSSFLANISTSQLNASFSDVRMYSLPVSLAPGSSRSFSFLITYSGVVQGTFEGIAYTTFSRGNDHFTTFVAFPLQATQQNNIYLYILVAIIIAIVLIITIIILRKRKKA
ncbi:MAG: CARDB domain-containing protein [Candidatus Micrarchaeia archaeon]